jgi:hypothetical protein
MVALHMWELEISAIKVSEIIYRVFGKNAVGRIKEKKHYIVCLEIHKCSYHERTYLNNTAVKCEKLNWIYQQTLMYIHINNLNLTIIRDHDKY